MDTNEMIDRYVNEVGQRLPRKTRADIEMELRSLLLDTLEEQSDGEPTPKEAAELLREFGSPETIAAQYRPAESLIGPKLFPTYKVVVTITVSIIGVLHLLGQGLVLWQNAGDDLSGHILNMALSFGHSAILNAGVVTLIFAVIERVAGDSLEPSEKMTIEWDPYALPPVKDPNRINRSEQAVGIFFGLLFLAWLNFFPNWFGGVNFDGEGSGIFVLVTAEFLALIPWLTASILLDMLLKTAVLIQGRWNRITRWLELAVAAFGLYVVYQIYSLEAISTVPVFSMMAKWGLLVVMVIVVLDLLAKLFRLLLGRPFTPQTLIISRLV